jgi:hypothetical protein
LDDFLKGLASPSWWMGVVIVGIIINVLSAYLKKPLDKLFGSISSGWRERSERKSKERNDLIDTLKSDESLLVLFALTENRYRTRSVGFLLMSFAMFSGSILLAETTIIASIAGLIFALLAALSGIHDHAEAIRIHSIVKDSNEKYKQICA